MTNSYEKLTPKLMLQLAAPHSWVASIIPVLVGCALACVSIGSESYFQIGGSHLRAQYVSIPLCIVLLAISVLFQSAVNVINDYFDFAKGTDTVENQPDPTDAVLVYNNLNPKHVLALAVSYIALAFILGIIIIAKVGAIPLIIAIIGALVVFLYSGGKHPISYLPLGEIVSGFTMGGLITFACYFSLTEKLDYLVLALSLPVVIGIALIMATNNICDIEKDVQAQRKTYAVIVGRKRAARHYQAAMIVWVASILLFILLFFTHAAFMTIPVFAYGTYKITLVSKNPLKPETRGPAFGQITSANKVLGLLYFLSILVSGII